MQNFLKNCALIASAGAMPALCAAQDAPQTVHIQFAAQVAGKPFLCGESYPAIGLSKTTVKGSDLRFFVSAVELVKADGTTAPLDLDQDGTWQYKNLALLDFEDGTASCSNGNAAIRKEISGTVPTGEYVGLRFTLGVPFELDHIDAASAPAPLNTSAMFWVWQSGYKFLRAEVKIAPPAATVVSASYSPQQTQAKPKPKSTGFSMHLGSTGCSAPTVTSTPAAECEHPNRPVIAFAAFDVTKDTVVFDLAKMLQGVDVTVGGCMSSPKSDGCAAPMQAFGLSFRDAPAAEQTVFTREARQ